MVDANALIEALKAGGFPVTGLTIYDIDDPSTWEFKGLPDDQQAAAVALVTTLVQADDRPSLLVTQRRLWQLFLPDEYVALAQARYAEVVRLKAIVRASESFDPAEAWVQEFFTACVAAGVLTDDRAEAIAQAINQPV